MEKPVFGVGLRHQHFPYLSESPPIQLDWFEVISENFLNTNGHPMDMLMKIRQDFPVSLHGVSMSLGSSDEFDQNYLHQLKSLISKVEPMLVSDHLCWTGLGNHNLHNLLPLSYSQETISFLCGRIDYVQNFLGREIAVENLSAYFSLKNSTMSEWDFLRELSVQSGAKILLDINNVYVNSVNQGFDAYEYLDGIPIDRVSEIHLAGFSDMGDFLFDTHSTHVCDDVWKLFSYKIKERRNIPVLIEWDEDIPDFPILEEEALKAKEIWKSHYEK